MHPSEQPLISVVVPSFNAAEFLPSALETIRAQRYANLEVMVVDDGSTDGTAAVVRQWPEVRYIRQENAGPSAARNAGIAAASGEILGFLDADDRWTEDHLQHLLPALLSDPNLAFVWGASKVIRLCRQADGSRMEEVLHESQSQFLIGSGLYRRTAFELVGPFDPAMRFAEDVDWVATARQRGVAYRQIPEIVLTYYKHEGGMTNGKTFRELNVMTALRRSISRHRDRAASANS